jgi:hypothetical protein
VHFSRLNVLYRAYICLSKPSQYAVVKHGLRSRTRESPDWRACGLQLAGHTWICLPSHLFRWHTEADVHGLRVEQKPAISCPNTVVCCCSKEKAFARVCAIIHRHYFAELSTRCHVQRFPTAHTHTPKTTIAMSCWNPIKSWQ